MKDVESELRGRRAEVEEILYTFPSTRNNDFLLEWIWLRRYAGLPLPYLQPEEVQNLSGVMTTIRRLRQKIQNEDGLYLPTDPKILEQRKLRERAMLQAIVRV